ncbi:MAG TPA: hypothetical protein VGR21_12600 [Cryptosporangiaceae bacterium]|nr:hypothetical protein [Cryptosporangiaceae bacterium]
MTYPPPPHDPGAQPGPTAGNPWQRPGGFSGQVPAGYPGGSPGGYPGESSGQAAGGYPGGYSGEAFGDRAGEGQPWTPPGQAGSPPDGDPLISPDYAGWWRRAVAVAKAAWVPLLLLQLVGAALALVLQGIPTVMQANQLAGIANDATPTLEEAQSAVGTAFANLGLSLVGLALSMVVSALITLAAVHVVVAVASGRRPSLGAAMRGAARRVGPLLGWEVLAALIILAGFCACVLPGFYLAGVFVTLPAVVAFERGPVIPRCFALFHQSLGPAAARIATIVGIGVAVALFGMLVSRILTAVVGPEGSSAFVGVGLGSLAFQLALAALVGVLVAPLVVGTYADLRARVDGQLSTRQLAADLHA